MAKRKGKPELHAEGNDWNFELLEAYDKEISRIAKQYKLDTYPNQIEVISSEQMMDAYSSVGMPINYNHWSFGKQFIQTEQGYKRGQMGLAYEIVINSNPCISYLMEENTMTMQALVMAHACYGHNSFFKNNHMFKTWTDADNIIDYLAYAKKYIADMEERHGTPQVEALLDSCHALMNYAVDRYKGPSSITRADIITRQQENEKFLREHFNEVLDKTAPLNNNTREVEASGRYPRDPEENILGFIRDNAPLLEPWQRDVIDIICNVSQYFYPQKQTQVMNEGWATFWHHTILNTMYDEDLVSDGFMLEFMKSHSGVVFQPDFDSPYYSGLNPYYLGFNMMQDIRRICENPTDEDKKWFPQIAGSDWLETLHHAMENYKDESFINQYLSPRLMREMRLFHIHDDDSRPTIKVQAIHDEEGYKDLRQSLANQYNLSKREPNIEVYDVDIRGDRSLTLRHTQDQRHPLYQQNAKEVLKHIHRLWGFDVRLLSYDNDNLTEKYECTKEGVKVETPTDRNRRAGKNMNPGYG